jgi:hypothetical protein
MFATLLPRPADWADEYGSTKGYSNWEKHAGAIPKEVTQRITSVAFSNYRSDNPLPMLMKIGANVDASYDVQIKNFCSRWHRIHRHPHALSESGAQVPGKSRTTGEGVGLNRTIPLARRQKASTTLEVLLAFLVRSARRLFLSYSLAIPVSLITRSYLAS